MQAIFLILFIFILALPARSQELSYVQRILLETEYSNAEAYLDNEVDFLDNARENIVDGKAVFDTNRKNVEQILAYVLMQLNEEDKKAFGTLVTLLNNEETRNLFYYPVIVKEGMSGYKTYYVALGDTRCVNPVKKGGIYRGIVIEINAESAFVIGQDSATIRLESINGIILAEYKVYENNPYFSLIKSTAEPEIDLTTYYNCKYVNSYNSINDSYKKLLKRYIEVGKILGKQPKVFKVKKPRIRDPAKKK